MKRQRILLVLLFAFVLVACGDDTSESGMVKNADGDVEVTFPANYFEGLSEDDIKANAKEQSVDIKEIHDDGSVTYTMTEERHAKLVEEVEASLEDVMKQLVEKDDYKSIQKISANGDYTEYDVTVDREAFESSMDMIGTMNLYVGSSFLHAYKNNPNPSITLNLIDAKNEEVYETIVLPDDMEEETSE